jgi:hypothetical protein
VKQQSAEQQAAAAVRAEREALIAHGKRFGISARYILEARRIFEEAPDLFKEVEAGKLRLFQAKLALSKRKRVAELERDYGPIRKKKKGKR